MSPSLHELERKEPRTDLVNSSVGVYDTGNSMAVSSDPGGMVPKMVSDRVMASKISEDVPSFLKWIESRPAAAQTATTAATASSRDGDNPPTLPQIERSEGL